MWTVKYKSSSKCRRRYLSRASKQEDISWFHMRLAGYYFKSFLGWPKATGSAQHGQGRSLSGNLSQPVSTADCSLGQGSSSTVHCIQVGVAQVQLAANQNDGRPGTEVLDLREPHSADMAQGVGIGQREAQHHYIGPVSWELREKNGWCVECNLNYYHK